MNLELAGKRAVVTGGGTGIGFAIAAELARQGASVVITSRRSDVIRDSAEKIAAETGSDVFGVVSDTGNDASVKALVDTVARAFGGIDILVNNAAEQPAQLGSCFLDADDERFQRQVNVKVIGYLRTIRAVAPQMIENQWGRIINISGTAARQTGSLIGSVRNASVVALSKNVADELGGHGINVNVVHPGLTRTRNHLDLQQKEEVGGFEPGRTAPNIVGRIVEPEEVAWVVSFLASPRSSAITGDCIVAGGGTPGLIFY